MVRHFPKKLDTNDSCGYPQLPFGAIVVLWATLDPNGKVDYIPRSTKRKQKISENGDARIQFATPENNRIRVKFTARLCFFWSEIDFFWRKYTRKRIRRISHSFFGLTNFFLVIRRFPTVSDARFLP